MRKAKIEIRNQFNDDHCIDGGPGNLISTVNRQWSWAINIKQQDNAG